MTRNRKIKVYLLETEACKNYNNPELFIFHVL